MAEPVDAPAERDANARPDLLGDQVQPIHAAGGEAEGQEEAEEGEELNPLPIVISDSLPLIMSQDDPRRMKLRMEEWQIAWTIKGVFASDPELDSISDYFIAQLALVCKDARIPAEDALQRFKDLQTFREEYSVRDTVEEGCRAIQELVPLIPAYILYFGFQVDCGTYGFVEDIAKFDTSHMDSSANFKKFMVGAYYLFHALNCDMEAIRKGAIFIVDCGGVGWSRKHDFKILKDVFSQLLCVYPFRTLAARHYNTGVIFNLLYTMVKKVLPRQLRDMLEFGYQKEGGLRELFLVPTQQEATQRVISRMQEALKRRYDNEKTFAIS